VQPEDHKFLSLVRTSRNAHRTSQNPARRAKVSMYGFPHTEPQACLCCVLEGGSVCERDSQQSEVMINLLAI
jgi:hypothetical protein